VHYVVECKKRLARDGEAAEKADHWPRVRWRELAIPDMAGRNLANKQRGAVLGQAQARQACSAPVDAFNRLLFFPQQRKSTSRRGLGQNERAKAPNEHLFPYARCS